MKGPMTEAEQATALAHYATGLLTVTEIGTLLGRRRNTIAALLHRRDVKVTRGPRVHPSLKGDFFSFPDTEETAYWLGFLSGDGCVHRGRSDRVTLGLHGRDADHVRLLRDTVAPALAVRESMKRNGARVLPYAQLCIHSTRMVEDLIRLGVTPNKSLSIRPWDGPLHLMRHYWRGFCDADGTISISQSDPSISLVGSFDVVAAFCAYGRSITGSVARVLSVGKVWTIRFGGGHSQILTRCLYLKANVSLARKQERAEVLMARTFRHRKPYLMAKSKTDQSS